MNHLITTVIFSGLLTVALLRPKIAKAMDRHRARARMNRELCYRIAVMRAAGAAGIE